MMADTDGDGGPQLTRDDHLVHARAKAAAMEALAGEVGDHLDALRAHDGGGGEPPARIPIAGAQAHRGFEPGSNNARTVAAMRPPGRR
jgi:hypothetical protein